MGLGIFGHVPTAEEIAGKAKEMARLDEEGMWSWPAYVAGLADAGERDLEPLMMAAVRGEFEGYNA